MFASHISVKFYLNQKGSTMQLHRKISLRHVQIHGKPMIGLSFRHDSEICNSVKAIPGTIWSSEFNMYCLPNTKNQLDNLFSIFRGKAWIDARHIYRNKPDFRGYETRSLEIFRHRSISEGYKPCPGSFIDRLNSRNAQSLLWSAASSQDCNIAESTCQGRCPAYDTCVE